MTENKALLGRLAIVGTALIWGTSFVILKTTLDSIDTMWILAIRFSVSAALLGLAGWKQLRKMDRAVVRGSVIMGCFLAAAYIVQTYGLKYTTPGKNAFLTATYCVLVPFMAWGVYRRRPDASNIAAAFLCIIGIGLVSLGGQNGAMNIGDALTLLCGVFYGIQIIMMEQYAGKGDALSITAVQFAAGARSVLTVHESAREVHSWREAQALINTLPLEVGLARVCWVSAARGVEMEGVG